MHDRPLAAPVEPDGAAAAAISSEERPCRAGDLKKNFQAEL